MVPSHGGRLGQRALVVVALEAWALDDGEELVPTVLQCVHRAVCSRTLQPMSEGPCIIHISQRLLSPPSPLPPPSPSSFPHPTCPTPPQAIPPIKIATSITRTASLGPSLVCAWIAVTRLSKAKVTGNVLIIGKILLPTRAFSRVHSLAGARAIPTAQR